MKDKVTKVETALARIRQAIESHDDNVFVANSGGKDSCVVLHLVKLISADMDFLVVHNTKLEPGKTHPLTRNFLYEQSAKFPILFINSGEMKDFLKVSGLTCQIDGTRRAEFDRTEKSDDVIINGESVNRKDMPGYVPEGIFGISACYPIYDWTDEDVFDFIREEGIEISKEYDEERAQ